VSNDIFEKLANAVVEMDEDEVELLCKTVIEQNINAFEAIDKGLTKGMAAAGQLLKKRNILFRNFSCVPMP